MKKIELKKRRLSYAKHCFIADCQLTDVFKKMYGRPNAMMKVFDLEEIKTEEDFYHVKWGDDPRKDEPRLNTRIWEATQIQNILAMHSLSVRVYGLETVSLADKLVPVQIVDLAHGENTIDEAIDVYDKAIEVGKEWGFGVDKRDVSAADVKGGKLIDVQTFAFNTPDTYKDYVRDTYIDNGRYGKVYYQNVPELGLTGGPRKSKQREHELALNKVDFKGKTVADFGCAGGYFTRYADNHEAKRVYGYDLLEPINAARHLANLLGNFNIDYWETDLSQGFHNNDSYDIVFYLSENYHIPTPQAVLEAKFVIFEDNGKETRHVEELGPDWTDNFKNIKIVGRATDHGDKLIYHLSK